MIKAGALLAEALVLAGPAARAQTYPSKQITLIIPFTPGGSNDLVGRAIGRKLSEAWGQPVVVENRGGGGTLIGSAAVAKAPPDGYTLLLVSPTFTINPATRRTMPFDTARDFTPIAFIGRATLLVTTSNKLPVSPPASCLPWPKANLARSPTPRQVLAASTRFPPNCRAAAGVKLAHVPYKGGAPALNDLAGGHVDMYISSIPQALQLVRSGQIKPLAVTAAGEQRCCPTCPRLRSAGHRAPMRKRGGASLARPGCLRMSLCAERGDQQDPDIARARHVSHQ